MNFTYSNFPLLKTDKKVIITDPKVKQIYNIVDLDIDSLRKIASRKNIAYLSKEFIDKATQIYHNTDDIFNKSISYLSSDSGSFLAKIQGHFFTICYQINVLQEERVTISYVVGSSTEDIIDYGTFYIEYRNDGIAHSGLTSFTSICYQNNLRDRLGNKYSLARAHYWSNMLLSVLFFYQISDYNEEVLVKSSNEKASTKKIGNTKHLTEIDLPIKILNKAWFTTLIKTEAFKVKGHFAIRACGRNREERKLVWIDEFSKNGYTRVAGSLKESITTKTI